MKKILSKLIEEYKTKLPEYKHMLDYYEGEHDIYSTYRRETNRSNKIVTINFISKFIEEELAYIFGNPVTYISKSGNDELIKLIDNSLFHWIDTHNQELCRQLEIFGTAYELYYINSDGEFSARILNPTNAAVYCDRDNKPIIFYTSISLNLKMIPIMTFIIMTG